MIEYAIFPFGQVERGSRCVIYGAGRAGQNFFRQVKGAGYCSIEYMVDRNWENIDVHGTVVRPMEALLDTFGYDCCVISILDPVIRQSIVDDIISLGIPQGKIVIPQNNEFCWFWYGFSSAKNEYEYAQSFENYFRCCDAREFVSSKRIDICIRYLLFKDFLNGLDNSAHLSLYSRYVLARTGGKDIAWFHSSDSPKNCVSDYVANGKKLVQSIAERGFKKESYVPVNNFNEPLDGLHRITAAIVSDEPIWVRKYPNSEQIHFDFLFFDKAGFNTEDKIRTLRAFADIYPGECTTAVLFAPVADMWLFIERQLAKSFTIVGSVDYDFCGNYVAFDNIVHEMYDDAAYCNSRIDRKIAVLKMSPLTMRVVLLSDEGFGGGGGDNEMSFWGRLKAVKCFLRDSIFFDIKEVPVVCHAPDNPEESVRLKHILLSVNNLNNNNKRFTQRYTNQFIDMLNAFKSWCTESNIPITDTVIVGSAPMVVFGIRKTNDIDFTFMPEYRKRLYGDGIHKISDTLKIVGKDFYSIGNEIISDETIITDDNLYFWFYGCKFLNLELVYKMKQSKRHLKDIEDLKLLDLFAELESVFDGKAALRKQVEDEMQRRKLHI